MCALQVLELDIQAVFQFDWPSRHKKSKAKEGGLAISSMNFKFGDKRGKGLRDTGWGEDSVGDGDTLAVMYEILVEGEPSVWSLVKPDDKEDVVVKQHDCHVRARDTQYISFGDVTTNPPPPFYASNAPHATIPDVDPVSGNQKTTKGGKAKMIEGYAGQAKGIKQILWECGLWREGMKTKVGFGLS